MIFILYLPSLLPLTLLNSSIHRIPSFKGLPPFFQVNQNITSYTKAPWLLIRKCTTTYFRNQNLTVNRNEKILVKKYYSSPRHPQRASNIRENSTVKQYSFRNLAKEACCRQRWSTKDRVMNPPREGKGREHSPGTLK